MIVFVKLKIDWHNRRCGLPGLLLVEAQQLLLHIYRCALLFLPRDLLDDIVELYYFYLCDDVFEVTYSQIVKDHVTVCLPVHDLFSQQQRNCYALYLFPVGDFTF